MIKITTLYSGSSGNCTLVQSDHAAILVDAGYSFKRLSVYLRQLGLTPCDIDAVLITHDHSDHISALRGWCEVMPETAIFCHERLFSALAYNGIVGNTVGFADKFSVKDLEIDFTTCSHDATFCCGYRFFDGTNYVATVTDTGVITSANLDFLAPCRTVLLESNHDPVMLKRGNYPPMLKRRILSERGHLSNLQASEVLSALLKEGNLKSVILGHLSENNNTHELAFNAAFTTLSMLGLTEGRDVHITVADQRKIGKTIVNL